MLQLLQHVNFYLSHHPSIVNFRWSPAVYASTWSFLFSVITLYVVAALTLHRFLSFVLPPRRTISLGPVPALHSLITAVLSLLIFLGILLSTAAEIRDTRWIWRRIKINTAFEWLLCFPPGTRASGRVFFWSYVFYLSRFLHLFRTFFTIFTKRKLTSFTLLNQSILLLMSFVWLEFSQSFQVVEILLTTLLYSVVYGYRFCIAVGLPRACFPFVVNCQVVVLACNLVCHFGVLSLHLTKGGCNGIGAWGFNAVLNGLILLLVLKFYAKVRFRKWTDYEVSCRGLKTCSEIDEHGKVC